MSDTEQIESEQIQGDGPPEYAQGAVAWVGPWMAIHATGHDTSIGILASLEWTRSMVINTAETFATDPAEVTNFESACRELDAQKIEFGKRATVLAGKQ